MLLGSRNSHLYFQNINKLNFPFKKVVSSPPILKPLYCPYVARFLMHSSLPSKCIHLVFLTTVRDGGDIKKGNFVINTLTLG